MELDATEAGSSRGPCRMRLLGNRIAGAIWGIVLAGGCADASGGDIVISEIMYQPASFDAREEYIELYNRGAIGYNLNGWKITSGVRFAFPNVVLMPGQYLAVAADLDRFRAVHPGVTNVVGGWEGRLGNNRETITIVDAFGKKQESLTYANQGDWAQRRRGPEDKGHRGWIWYAAHDGGGSSLELINVQLTNQEGQNWGASLVAGGTPGGPNSIARTNIAPIVRNVAHAPAVPRSTQPVTITAQVLDELPIGIEVYLFHRADGSPQFEQERMWDDGKHGDGAPGDGVYGVVLPPRPADTVVEFYVSAADSFGNRRTWPAPIQPEGTQSANCLYQVSDELEPDGRPFYRLVMTEAERLELAEIGQMPWYWSSDAQMNATFISTEFGETEVRYLAGLRMRGTTSRDPSIPAKSRRVNFPNDRPWRGRFAISLNGLNPHSQVLAGTLCRLAGVPAAEARFVRVRENNRQITPSDALPYGWHAEVEVINNEFVSRQFPLDPNGNLYRADGGNLEYLGENPSNYVYIVTSTGARYPNYSKQTNVSEDDWSDLIFLTRVLNTTPASEYAQAVQSAVDVDEWLRYFAIFTMLASTETSIATGSNGDFSLYSGRADPRFKLVARDLDSTFGMEGGLYAEIYRATNNAAVNRFLTCPEFGPRYNAELRRLSDTLFEPGRLGLIIDRVLAGYLPGTVVDAMKEFGAARRAYVASQIQSSMWVSSSLPIRNWHMYTTVPSVTLYGAVDASRTSKVLVGGREATLNALTGIWSIDGVELLPGVNRVLVCAFDSAGAEVGRQLAAIWYDTGRSTTVSGQLASSTLWEAAKGPYLVTGDVVVPAGVTLRIGPGTSVFVEQDKRLIVRGRLLAEGSADKLIRMTRPPAASYNWGGIVFENATNQSRLKYVEMAFLSKPAITLTNSSLLVEDSSWDAITATTIVTYDSSLVVRRSKFPAVAWTETVSGLGIPADGQVIFEGNYFAAPTGYADVIDFTGGHRPGPILQVLGNTFAGGGDDGLDLDGTDAHVEGNVFMHFHKNNDTSSESSAISTGIYNGETSSITVVRNVFFDNDHDIILKDWARLVAENNTFVGSKYGSLCFKEPLRPFDNPPASVLADGCIWWGMPLVMTYLDTNLMATGAMQVSVIRSILPQPGPWSGAGNVNANPRFVDEKGDFHLLPGSPAWGTGPLGLDMGAYVPAGTKVVSDVAAETWRTNASFIVGGPGMVAYKYRIDGSAWSEERLVSQPVQLTGLANGRHVVEVIGKNSAGVWEEEARQAGSVAWTVNRLLRRVRINEVLAQNYGVSSMYDRFPDLVELYNDSPESCDLAGMSLTDDPIAPRKFVFPPGAVIAPGGYLVLAADSRSSDQGYHLGFGLDTSGDALYLYDRPENGGRLLDSVVFGLQIADLSIGRLDDGSWGLTLPTFGGPNIARPMGDARRLRINEWLANPGAYQPDDFVELFNPDSLPVAIGGFCFTDEPIGAPCRHTIQPLSFVSAMGFAVFIADGKTNGPADHFGFKLNSRQGLIALFTDRAELIDVVFYGPQAPGNSEGRSPSGADNIAAFAVPTPGSDSPPVVNSDAVVINEIMANNRSHFDASGALRDWVELYNKSAQAVDLAGLGLTDRLDQPYRWMFPPGASIQPNGYLVVYFDSQSAPSATNTGFGLSANGDAVYMFDRPGSGPTRVLDAVEFGVQAGDYTVGRVPDGAGEWGLNQPTPGTPNKTAVMGSAEDLRINEWMANPLPGDEDWIEIYNSSALPVAIGGLYLTDNLADPFKFPIRPLSFIGVGLSAFQLFVADGNETAGANHVNFKLSAGGESIGLADGAGRFIDSIVFGAQQEGVSEGRFPDGSGSIMSFGLNPTPGWRNSPVSGPNLVLYLLKSGEVMLRWNSVPGQKFQVQSTRSLATPQWETMRTMDAADRETVLVIPTEDGASCYYRVLVMR